jgi:hypothetical protein
LAGKRQKHQELNKWRSKRIDYYGRFEATPADESTARRYQALAGLASDVGKIALKLGEQKIQERAAKAEIEGEKAGTIAGFEAAKERDVLELEEDFTVYNQAFRSAAEASYLAGTKNDLTNLIAESEATHPDDIAAFQESSRSRFLGLTGNLPDHLKPDVELYYDQINKASAARVLKAQKTQINENNRAIFDDYVANQTTNLTNLARSNDAEGLAAARIQFLEEGKAAIEAGIIDATDFGVIERTSNQEIVKQYVLGEFEGSGN